MMHQLTNGAQPGSPIRTPILLPKELPEHLPPQASIDCRWRYSVLPDCRQKLVRPWTSRYHGRLGNWTRSRVPTPPLNFEDAPFGIVMVETRCWSSDLRSRRREGSLAHASGFLESLELTMAVGPNRDQRNFKTSVTSSLLHEPMFGRE